MRSVACCNYEFEPSRWHGFLSRVNIVCLHLEVLLTVCVCVCVYVCVCVSMRMIRSIS